MKRARLFAFATLLVASSAFAQGTLPERRVDVSFRGGDLHVGFSARDLVDESVRRSLASGLTKHFVLTVQTYQRNSTTPFSTRQLRCAVTYDLWQEAYVVSRGRRREVVATADLAIARCLLVQNASIADVAVIAAHRGREIFVAVRAEFNPISGGACARSLRRPGGDDPLGPVVVNIVRREICQAERASNFRSSYVRVP
jgi:hypothetical protein